MNFWHTAIEALGKSAVNLAIVQLIGFLIWPLVKPTWTAWKKKYNLALKNKPKALKALLIKLPEFSFFLVLIYCVSIGAAYLTARKVSQKFDAQAAQMKIDFDKALNTPRTEYNFKDGTSIRQSPQGTCIGGASFCNQ